MVYNQDEYIFNNEYIRKLRPIRFFILIYCAVNFFLVSSVASAIAMSYNYPIPYPDGTYGVAFSSANVGDDYFFFSPTNSGYADFEVENPSVGFLYSHDLILSKQTSSGWSEVKSITDTTDLLRISHVYLSSSNIYRLAYDEPYLGGDSVTLKMFLPEPQLNAISLDSAGDAQYSASISPGSNLDYFWYTAPATGFLEIDTTDSTLGFDTDLFSFRLSSGNWIRGIYDLGDADNGNLSLSVIAGEKYVFVVGSSDLETGSYNIIFQGPARPNKPSITQPSVSTGLGLTPHFATSAFSDSDNGDTLYLTYWELFKNSNRSNAIWTYSDYDTNNTTVDPPITLEYDTEYYLRVRHVDNNHDVSDTAEKVFKTKSAPVVLESVVISGDDSVHEDATSNYRLTGYYSDNTNRVVTNSASWSVSPAYASIGSSNGILTANTVSSDKVVIITANFNGKTDTYSVVITDTVLDHVAITDGPGQVDENSTNNYILTAYLSDGSSENVTSNSWTSWSVASAYASINSNGSLTVAEVNSDQIVTITAQYGSKQSSKIVTINNVTVPHVTIWGDTEVTEETTANYTLRRYYSDGTNEDVTNLANWSVSPSYASIGNNTGILTANNVSSSQDVTITAIFNGMSDTHSVTIIDNVKVVKPSISPNGGTFMGSTPVAISCSTLGAKIYYTTDGTIPNNSSTEYTGPFTVSSSCTVNARGYKSGFTSSDVASASFVEGSPPGGSYYKYETSFNGTFSDGPSSLAVDLGDNHVYFRNNGIIYQYDNTGSILSSFSCLTGKGLAVDYYDAVYVPSYDKSTETVTINVYSKSGDTWYKIRSWNLNLPYNPTDNNAQSLSIIANNSSATRIYVLCSDEFEGSSVQEFDRLGNLIDSWSPNNMNTTPCDMTYEYNNQLFYFLNYNGGSVYKFDLSGSFVSSWDTFTEGSAGISVSPAISSLVAIPDPGNKRVQLFMSSGGLLDSINGGDMDTPEAVCMSSGGERLFVWDSVQKTLRSFKWQSKVGTPIISPSGGTFTSSQQVELINYTIDAKVFYTIDGTIPTTNSTEYTGPFTISSPSLIIARGFRDGFIDSNIAYAAFNITSYDWSTGDWSECSVSCGVGIQSRSVECIEFNFQEIVDDIYCEGPKPVTQQECNPNGNDPTVYPGAPELCDGQLNNCSNGLGVPINELDKDGDGYIGCAPIDAGGWDGVGNPIGGGDCDDTESGGLINPGGTEVCWNGVDDDCDGVLDNGCTADADGDGHNSISSGGDDCDDSDPTIYPEAMELCDGQDNDCDGLLPLVELDIDKDGFIECTFDAGGWDGDLGIIGDHDNCPEDVSKIVPGDCGCGVADIDSNSNGRSDCLDNGDVNEDWIVDLADAILALQLTVNISPQTININSDVNGDVKIGIHEVLYILQKVSDSR